MVVFLEPAVELRQVAREPNRIAVLIDDSKSMSLAESPQGPTRIERARRLIASSADTLATWERDHKIDYYTFSDTLSSTTPAALASNTAQKRKRRRSARHSSSCAAATGAAISQASC